MNWAHRVRMKEREIELARATITESVGEMRALVRRRLTSRTAMAVGFGSGVVLGLLGRRRRPRVQLPKQAREAMPKHWFGHYIVWPFLLATARDWVVAQRPTPQARDDRQV